MFYKNKEENFRDQDISEHYSTLNHKKIPNQKFIHNVKSSTITNNFISSYSKFISNYSSNQLQKQSLCQQHKFSKNNNQQILLASNNLISKKRQQWNHLRTYTNSVSGSRKKRTITESFDLNHDYKILSEMTSHFKMNTRQASFSKDLKSLPKNKSLYDLRSRHKLQRQQKNKEFFSKYKRKRSKQASFNNKNNLCEKQNNINSKFEKYCRNSKEKFEYNKLKTCQKKINLKNYKLSINKFIKQFVSAIADIKPMQNTVINQIQIIQILFQLGFIRDKKILTFEKQNTEKLLLQDLLQLLTINQSNIKLINLLIILLTIIGLYNIQDLHFKQLQTIVDKNINTGLSKKTFKNDKFIIRANEAGIYDIDETTGIKIQKWFSMLYGNRLSKNVRKNKLEIVVAENYNFKPKLSKKSIQLAHNYREKLFKNSNQKFKINKQNKKVRDSQNLQNICIQFNKLDVKTYQTCNSIQIEQQIQKQKSTNDHKSPILIIELNIADTIHKLQIYEDQAQNPQKIVQQLSQKYQIDHQGQFELLQLIKNSLAQSS